MQLNKFFIYETKNTNIEDLWFLFSYVLLINYNKQVSNITDYCNLGE